jgi:hypothetical protein
MAFLAPVPVYPTGAVKFDLRCLVDAPLIPRRVRVWLLNPAVILPRLLVKFKILAPRHELKYKLNKIIFTSRLTVTTGWFILMKIK